MAKAVNTPQFWGMVIYQKVGDGCLNGLWNNNDVNNQGRIHNEIARKTSGIPNDTNGDYAVSWIEANNDIISGTLQVRPINNNTAFSFHWINEGVIAFRGVGMDIGSNQIAVTYWDSETIAFNV